MLYVWYGRMYPSEQDSTSSHTRCGSSFIDSERKEGREEGGNSVHQLPLRVGSRVVEIKSYSREFFSNYQRVRTGMGANNRFSSVAVKLAPMLTIRLKCLDAITLPATIRSTTSTRKS